jgi:hypothetical protein
MSTEQDQDTTTGITPEERQAIRKLVRPPLGAVALGTKACDEFWATIEDAYVAVKTFNAELLPVLDAFMENVEANIQAKLVPMARAYNSAAKQVLAMDTGVESEDREFMGRGLPPQVEGVARVLYTTRDVVLQQGHRPEVASYLIFATEAGCRAAALLMDHIAPKTVAIPADPEKGTKAVKLSDILTEQDKDMLIRTFRTYSTITKETKKLAAGIAGAMAPGQEDALRKKTRELTQLAVFCAASYVGFYARYKVMQAREELAPGATPVNGFYTTMLAVGLDPESPYIDHVDRMAPWWVKQQAGPDYNAAHNQARKQAVALRIEQEQAATSGQEVGE